MCGKKGELTEAVVEGVVMHVCNTCSKFGHVVPLQPNVVKEDQRRVQEKKVFKKTDDLTEGIVDDFAKIVKQGREKKGLKQEELAKEIAEKESLMHSVESGHIKPSFKTAKKLEVFLGIKLIEKYEKKAETKDVNFKDESLTIADLLRAKKDE